MIAKIVCMSLAYESYKKILRRRRGTTVVTGSLPLGLVFVAIVVAVVVKKGASARRRRLGAAATAPSTPQPVSLP